ncbi:rho GTPase-activating protein 32 isoform X1 [Electrophorus electricus]|uniref:rho GTPase-activating protein 32 isoform X1 n=2 Tax=Electrophorus electricus TaxID=8005 RepID=UPI0015D0517B|nr:rho GTPase-activating protein 32 isoform X1 [Electrophorus electricus]
MEAGSGAAAVVGSAVLGLLGATGSHDISDRGLRPCRHPEEDDIVPEIARSIHPRERPDWEETISAMARSAEVPELSSEPLLRSGSSTASMKVKNVKKLSFTKGHFPKLAECAHFHYENVDFGTIQLNLAEEQNEVTRNGLESKELVYLVQIYCQGRSWIVRRSYEDFRVLDKHLHLCIYDRRFSQLPELPRFDSLRERAEAISQMLMAYLSRLSAIADNKINCGPALTWMEVDNKGNHLLVHEESSINVPAIAAAHVIKRYIAQAADELSFEVGDIVSVIDMPPKEDTTWWRGKHGFQVGFFPSECVELINDKVPQSVTNSVPKPASPCSGLRPASWSLFPPYLEMESVKQDNTWVPDPLNPYRLSSVSKKHGKLITFLRSFMKSRPTKQKLKQRGILRERVFGCDLGEHLLNSGHDVPQVLKSCTDFIEKHGVVDGMYRLSGIASNIQKLRHEFDSEQIPDLTKDVYIQDIHCVGSLCKLYFRELPNPLLTYQLYEKFSEAVSAATDEERLIKIHDVIQQLPPPHYRTLEFLMRHLSRLATFSYVTNMHSKNLAIVWAPNLLRSKQIESACFSGTAAFMEVRIQSVVVEFILNHVDVLFSPKLSSLIREGAGHNSLSRPKSLLVPSPSTKLLTLEEAQARTQAQINSPVTADSKYIEVGEGPAALQGKFHTVIEFPTERKRQPIKSKKSPVGSWRSFFNLGKSSSMSKRKLHRNPSEPNELKAMALAGGRGDTGTLRSAKSEESLSSLHNVEGESKVYRPRRPRSSSDALSTSFNGDLLDSRQHCNSYDNLGHGDSDGDDGPICVPALISPPRSADDVDLSPPDIGMATLDFDPMSFQCSLPLAESSILSTETDAVSLKRSPGSASGSEPLSPARVKVTSPYQSSELNLVLRDATQLGSNTSEKIMSQTSEGCEKVSALAPQSIFDPKDASTPSKGPESPLLQPSSPSPQDSPSKISSLSLKSTDLPLSEAIKLELLSKSALCENKETKGASGMERTGAASAQEQPGAVALDPPKGTASISSVSLLPPPPQPKNPARMLALALAESAQQATILSQGRSSGPPTPLSPLRPQELLETLDWPPPPTLQSQTSKEEAVEVPHTTAPSSSPPSCTSAEPTLTHCASLHLSIVDSAKLPSIPCNTEAIVTAIASSQNAAPASQPVQLSPAHKSPERQLLSVGPTLVSTSSTTTAATTPTMGRNEVTSRVTPQPSSEFHTAESVLPPPTKKSPEQPVAVLQPQRQMQGQPQIAFQSQPQPQPHSQCKTQASAWIAPTPVVPPEQSTERPREAVKPVTPRVESVPLHHPHGVTPPVPPVRSLESKLATAALSKAEATSAAAYHAMLADASLPASLDDTLTQSHSSQRKSSMHQSAYVYHSKGETTLLEPAGEAYYHQRATPAGQQSMTCHYRPESVPPHISCVSKSEPQISYRAHGDGRYNTIGPRSLHQSMKYRGPIRGEYISSGSVHRSSHGYGPLDGPAVYPTIRRVHSLHVPPTAIRSMPMTRTEVPPDDELYYYQRPVYHCKSYQQPSQTEYHVTQLQPYFENGRVQYRYSPYSGSHPLDAPYYDVDPYGTIRLRHFHSFNSRDTGPHLTRTGGKSGGYHYMSRHVIPVKEHSFVSRDMPPYHGSKGAVYIAWDPDEAERFRMHSIRRESRARQKVKGPVMSQYDNVGPYMSADIGGLEVLHLRSKSDPGKAGLMAAETKDGRYSGASASQHASRHLISDPDVLMYMETEKYCQGNGMGDKVAAPKQSSSRTYQSAHSQPPPRSMPHLSEGNHPEAKFEPGDKQLGSKHWQEHPENRSYQPRYDRPDAERHIGRVKTTSGNSEDDQQTAQVKPIPPPKPERSHSIRERQHLTQPNPPPHVQDSLDRDHGGSCSHQPHGQRQNTIALQSHYDNLDDYHLVPHSQNFPLNRGGLSSYHPPGYTASHSNRAYSTALGQGAFIQAELAMQRPEPEINTE